MSVPGDLVESARTTCAGFSFEELVREGDGLQQDWFDKLGTEQETARPGSGAYPVMAELAVAFDLRGWSHYVFSYADPVSWRSEPDGHVHRITKEQPALWAQWQAWPGPMCNPKHADHFDVADAFGYVLDGRLVSVGQIEAYRDEYAWEYGVDTLPAYRCRGYATAVLKAVTSHIVRCGRVPYHYTDAYNRPSMRLPGKLGYFRYAEGLFSHARC
jgi:RimJ/RimL family protein N-acetyltransferase